VGSLGRTLFGIAVAASGLLQLAIGDFVRLVPKLPTWVPAPGLVPYLTGVVLVVAGLAILSDRSARPAALVVGALLFGSLLLRLPQLALPWADRPYLRGFLWTNPLKTLALIGGALVVARGPSAGRYGAILLALFLFVAGLQHFAYGDFVTAMVPAWMPERRFWAYFTGVALIAGGAGLVAPATARLAAMLSGAMIFSWVFLLHLPRALAGPRHADETAGVFEALAISGVALLVANRPRS
jgi:uncharacterized membrane protein